MAMIGGGLGSGQAASQVLSSLGLEMNNLRRGLEATIDGMAAQMPAMLQSLQSALAGMGGQAGIVGQSITKTAFISVLHAALEKASKNPQFNLETAINDLWIHLDAVRRFTGASNVATIDSEAKKLQGMMRTHTQLFSLLSEMMKMRNEMQTGVIRNLR